MRYQKMFAIALSVLFVVVGPLGAGPAYAQEPEETLYFPLIVGAPQSGPLTAPGAPACTQVISPDQSLSSALKGLKPGDVLCLRGGVYREHDIRVDLKGTAEKPIHIQSHPGERARIANVWTNLTWELVDADIGLYRSRESVSGSDYGGWLMDDEIQLLYYTEFNRLKTEKYSGSGAYVGPGIHVSGGRVYIRLQQNPNHLRDHQDNPIQPVPADTDPNHNRIEIFSGHNTFIFGNATHIVLRDLDIGPSHYVFDIGSGSHNIHVLYSLIRLKSYGFIVREGSDGLEVGHSTIRMGFPEWIFWGDVKASDKPAYHVGWNSFAINGTLKDSRIHHNLFVDCFDGVFVNTHSRNVQVTDNFFFGCRDDALDLRPGVRNVEIARNVIRHCYEGISVVGGSGQDQDVYIHHNVVDITRYFRKYRPDTWETGHVWGNHTCSAGCSVTWQVYNNTIIGKDVVLDRYVSPWSNGRVMNNLIVAIGSAAVPSLRPADGNIFWRSVDNPANDPGIDLGAVQRHTYDATSAWSLYRPTNGQVYTPGASYAGLGWPGTEGVDYRGAVGR